MAIELISRIWRRPRSEFDSSEKWVLTIMADRADEEGMLWYAVDTIAELTSLTARGVQKIMDRLIAKGLVKKLHRRDKSNYYIIAVDKFPHVERKSRPKEKGQRDQLLAELDQEPDLFGTGEPGSGTGERRSVTGERRSVTGEPGSPDSLTDSLSDSLMDARSAEGGSIEDLIVSLWNDLAAKHEAFQAVRYLSDERKQKIKLRTEDGLKACPQPRTEPGFATEPFSPAAMWRDVFEVIGRSKLLTGQKTAWAATFDWILGKQNFAKIIGGNYGHGHDEIGGTAVTPNGRSAVAAGQAARELVKRAGLSRRGPASRRSGGRS